MKSRKTLRNILKCSNLHTDRTPKDRFEMGAGCRLCHGHNFSRFHGVFQKKGQNRVGSYPISVRGLVIPDPALTPVQDKQTFLYILCSSYLLNPQYGYKYGWYWE